ncbi:MAG: hypothetical protein JRJ02_04465 [Deltaproteobacteria bacterium]|nr:hypothetical protein [Deltaproteobacteria bacterium]MBW1861611.1 hypothetical protein [Deltaproteobacteria bacterium]
MQSTDDLNNPNEMLFEAVSPVGDIAIKTIHVSPSLNTLEGKTICELSADMYSYDVSFPVISEILKQRYEGVKILPHTEFPEITMMTPGPEYQKYVENQVAMLKRKNCDAVILGNGG